MNDHFNSGEPTLGAMAKGPASPNADGFDATSYMDDLADLEMTEAQMLELLETLWSIMGEFVRLGYSVDVVDLCCGRFVEEAAENPASAPDTLDLAHSITTETPSDGQR